MVIDVVTSDDSTEVPEIDNSPRTFTDSHSYWKNDLALSRLCPPDWTRRQQHTSLQNGGGRYTAAQTHELNRIFDLNRFPTSQNHSEIGKTLKLSRFQVKKWFQNRRAKERRKLRDFWSRTLSILCCISSLFIWYFLYKVFLCILQVRQCKICFFNYLHKYD